MGGIFGGGGSGTAVQSPEDIERDAYELEKLKIEEANRAISDKKAAEYKTGLAKARAGAAGVGFGGTVNSYLTEMSKASSDLDQALAGFWNSPGTQVQKEA